MAYLRALSQRDRWSEEVCLVQAEMDWTRRYFQMKEKQWGKRAKDAADAGYVAYARRQEMMWEQLASQVTGVMDSLVEERKAIVLKFKRKHSEQDSDGVDVVLEKHSAL